MANCFIKYCLAKTENSAQNAKYFELRKKINYNFQNVSKLQLEIDQLDIGNFEHLTEYLRYFSSNPRKSTTH